MPPPGGGDLLPETVRAADHGPEELAITADDDDRPPAGSEAHGGHGSSSVDDDVLARRARVGDREAFAQLVDRHGPALHRYASRMLDDPSETADCLQDAFADAWRGLPGWEGRAQVRTWLFTLVTHAVRRHQSRHLRKTPKPVDDEQLRTRVGASTSSDPARIVEMEDFVRALDAALGTLPEGQRSAWLLREVEGLSYAEIAEISAATPDVVRGRLSRARASLEVAMEDWR
ncbi:RNA polymerase sigma-70 factor, ECF subfamily [Quadrisphaera granulorum]|uniref:RNA polymerase sigma-70 factor (ECF subfamily) n=1 Tax=Quadrisphaera granulorum TaxID=317664 RepID=A0A316A5P4_9ACTN|nr:sigma-70 family RNA polymerase sigma factor [Quadrisphaera granulorum]PWJ52802.1 RNA polymerase sigma-70 factor (ECF subfamily) [Quadrisphaera granulorum]SZE97407.1 RNA polymerase sigma-70 factor, ECF subfamily [Quadrisphaera granulorum]